MGRSQRRHLPSSIHENTLRRSKRRKHVAATWSNETDEDGNRRKTTKGRVVEVVATLMSEESSVNIEEEALPLEVTDETTGYVAEEAPEEGETTESEEASDILAASPFGKAASRSYVNADGGPSRLLGWQGSMSFGR